MIKQSIIFLISLLISVALAKSPEANKIPRAPDNILLGQGQSWFYKTTTASNPQKLIFREPVAHEIPIINQAKDLFERSSAKAMALLDGNEVVWLSYKAPATEKSLYMSYSIGKTVTSMAVGKAICANKLSKEDVVEKLLPDLVNTDLGKATVHDLLRMSSGTWEGHADTTIYSSDQAKLIFSGKLNFYDLLKDHNINSGHKNLLGNKRVPGEVFAYRSTDPLALGVIINKATKVSYAEWVEKEILSNVAISEPAIIGQDKLGYGWADGNLRLSFNDWLRFAVWVKEQEKKQGCFGDYVREASRTQIKNLSKTVGQNFDGYGYFLWTDNLLLRDSYWAVGYGGQRIGWTRKNNRMIIVFSNAEDWMLDLYQLYRDWSNLELK